MTLYHYTSNETFLSIIQNKILYLSDLRLSNDSDEGKYAFQLVKDIIAEDKSWSAENFNFDVMGDINIALGFCLSLEGDLLSQWRAYASDGGGISIGFSCDYLKKLVTEEDSGKYPLQLSKVVYDKASQKELLKKKLDLESKKIPEQKIPKLGELTDIWLEEQHNEKRKRYFDLIIPVILDLFTFKNSFFSEEKEWRIIRSITRGSLRDENNSIDFRMSGDRIVPFNKLPIQEDLSSAITKIILGPKNDTPKDVIEALLHKNDFKNVEITRSKGSYR